MSYNPVEVDLEWDWKEVEQFKQESGHNSFPNIFIEDDNIKGDTELQKLYRNGHLFDILERNKISFVKK